MAILVVDDDAALRKALKRLLVANGFAVEVAEDGAEVFAGGDGAPAADGVEANSDRALRQQRRRFVTDDCVGVVDAEDEEADAVSRGFAILACAAGGSKLVGAEDVLGTEITRAQAVGAPENGGNLFKRDLWQTGVVLNGLGERGANVAAKRVVARESFVGALEDDDVLLAL